MLVAERNLAGAAFGHLTEAFMTLPFEALGPVKTLLKRYLSAGPWSAEDDDALAAAAGAGEGWWDRELDPDVTLSFGWAGRAVPGRAPVDGGAGAGAGSVARPHLRRSGRARGHPEPPHDPVRVRPSRSTPAPAAGTSRPPRPPTTRPSPASSPSSTGWPTCWSARTSWPSACAGPTTGRRCWPRSWPSSPRSSPILTRRRATPVGSAGGPAWLAGGRPGRRLDRRPPADPPGAGVARPGLAPPRRTRRPGPGARRRRRPRRLPPPGGGQPPARG